MVFRTNFAAAAASAVRGDARPLLEAFNRQQRDNADSAWLAVWDLCSNSSEPVFPRTLAHLLATQPLTNVSRISFAWLLANPSGHDPTTLLNALAALDATAECSTPFPPILRSHIWPFIRTCLTHSEISVRFAAVHTMATFTDLGIHRDFLNVAAAKELAQSLGSLSAEANELDQRDLTFIKESLGKTDLPRLMPAAPEEYQSAIGTLRKTSRIGGDVGTAAQSLLAHARALGMLEDAAEDAASAEQSIYTFRVREPAPLTLIERVVSLGRALIERRLPHHVLPDRTALLFAPSTASFAIHVAFPDTSDSGETFALLRSLFGAVTRDAETLVAALTTLAREEITLFGRILEDLHQNDTALTVTLTDPAGSDWRRSTILVPPGKPKLTQRTLSQAVSVARRVQHQLSSADIPQADTISRVISLAEAVVAGDNIEPRTLGDDVDTKRQVAYYRQAARILGVLDRNNEPTERANALSGLDRERQLALLCVYFEESRVAQAWKRWNNADRLTGVDPFTAEAFLSATVDGLSGATVPRRADTLRRWLAEVIPYHYTEWEPTRRRDTT